MEYRVRHKSMLSAFAITVGLCFSMQAYAQDANSGDNTMTAYASKDGGDARINFSGKLRMLSQRIPAAACVSTNADNADTAIEALTQANAEFQNILLALRNGNDEMGVFGAEKERRILAKLDDISARWEPFHAAASDIIAGKNLEESMKHLSENNMALLEAAKALVVEVTAEYANPYEMTAENALLIDYAGRQRMLTQKTAKEGCGVETGNEILGTLDDMKATMSMFEITLNALRDGMPAAGVQAPPTEEIHSELLIATDRWNEAKSILESETGEGSIGSEAETQLFDILTKELKEMNKITGLYAEYTKTVN